MTNATHTIRTLLCCVALLISTACGPTSIAPELGIQFAAQIKQSDLAAIRSFRVLAFEENKVYKCYAQEHSVRYGTSGFTASATFDWQITSGETPEVRLFLPEGSIAKSWTIQVEAFTVSRLSQTGEAPVATGCAANVRMFDDRPVPINIELHSKK